MLDIFMYSFNAVMPILLLVFTGCILKKIGFASDDFFKKANSLVFRLFLPILLFYNIYEIESLSNVNWAVVLYCVAAVVVLFLLGLVIARFFIPDRSQKGPVIQCTFRSNCAVVGIPLAEALGGSAAVSFTAVATSATIPLFNALAVICLSYFSTEKKKGLFKSTVLRTLKNPLIIGVAVGLCTIWVRSLLPLRADGEICFSLQRDLGFLFKAITMAADVASPLALVVLGARFDFSAVKGMLRQISIGVFMRLVFAPAFAVFFAVLLTKLNIISVTSAEYPAIVSIFASPIAVSSAVMIGEIGGDDQLGAQLVVWTSALSMLTIFVTVFVMKSMALL